MDKTLELTKINTLKAEGYYDFTLPYTGTVPQGFILDGLVLRRIISTKDQDEWNKIKAEQGIMKETNI